MATREVYRVNSPRVIFEIIDGELIMVHMDRGAYYTADDVGAAVWDLITSGCTVAEMCRWLAARYEGGAQEIEAGVQSFIERLRAEDLISPAEATDGQAMPAPPVAIQRGRFHPPDLQSYRDMEDMLALDPIHDVEAAGWPVPKSDDGPPAETESA
jgi:coenzyme PQQ synthesis protein D (PqqD)